MEAMTMPRTQADSSSMRALLQSGYGGPEVFRMGETTRPKPAPGEVLVRVQAAGVDRGTWHLMTGRPYLMRLMGFGFSAPKNPVGGLDLAGTVVELGEGVTRFRVGDAVFGIGRGTFAEYSCASEAKLVHKPQNLSFEQAAVLAVSAITAQQALCDAGQVRAGERVLIIGASGGVGTYAVQLAKAYGATVTAVCSGSKVERVRALGADHVIDYKQQDFADGSQRYDLILDIAGNTAVAKLRRALTTTGRLVFVGGEHGGDWTAGFERQLYGALLGLFVKQRFIALMSQERWEPMQVVAELAEQGKLSPAIDRHCTLAEIPSALTDLEAGKVYGKIVVRVA